MSSLNGRRGRGTLIVVTTPSWQAVALSLALWTIIIGTAWLAL